MQPLSEVNGKENRVIPAYTKFWMEPKNIDIEGTFEVTEFKGIEYRNGANPETLAVAKVLVQKLF